MQNYKLNPLQVSELSNKGFIILKNILTEDNVTAIANRLDELWEYEKNKAGHENDYTEPGVKRLADLINKGTVFRPLYTHPTILDAMYYILGNNYKLEMINAREPTMKAGGMPQELHCDISDADRETNKGLAKNENGFFIATAVFLLDDFTIKNGCTSIVPGSHHFNELPENAVEDVYKMHKDEIFLEGSRGDVFLFNGHCWHRGSANTSTKRRRSILLHYKRIDVESYHIKKHNVSDKNFKELLPWEKNLVI